MPPRVNEPDRLGRAVASCADQALRNEPMMRLRSSRVRVPDRFPACRASDGSERSAPAIPSHSRPTVGARGREVPVTASLAPADSEKAKTRPAGYSRVRMFTCAPEKSPGWSGVKVLEVVTVCSIPAGKRSSGTIFRSGSGLGMRAPFSEVVV